MSRKTMTKTFHFCSFCGKSQEDVETIIAGPDDVDICDECVDICNDIIKENKSKVSKG